MNREAILASVQQSEGSVESPISTTGRGVLLLIPIATVDWRGTELLLQAKFTAETPWLLPVILYHPLLTCLTLTLEFAKLGINEVALTSICRSSHRAVAAYMILHAGPKECIWPGQPENPQHKWMCPVHHQGVGLTATGGSMQGFVCMQESLQAMKERMTGAVHLTIPITSGRFRFPALPSLFQ